MAWWWPFGISPCACRVAAGEIAVSAHDIGIIDGKIWRSSRSSVKNRFNVGNGSIIGAIGAVARPHQTIAVVPKSSVTNGVTCTAVA